MCGRIQPQDVFKVHIQNLFDLALIKNLLIILFNHLQAASLHLTGVSQIEHILIILMQIFLELHIMYHPLTPHPNRRAEWKRGADLHHKHS